MKICIINYSGRENGNCRKISDIVADKFNNKVKRYDFYNVNITPCGKCNDECFFKRENCPYIADDIFKIYEDLTHCDTAYFIVPNYCDYPCANYFSFNERSQCYFQGEFKLLEKFLKVKKKFIVVSNTEKENFINAFKYQVEENTVPDVLFISAKTYGKVSINGDITDSKEAVADIKNFLK